MEKSKNKIIGDFGEKQAQKYLRKNKYKILCTNYRQKYGEIDIIAEKDNYVIDSFYKIKKKIRNRENK